MHVEQLIADLGSEQQALDTIVAALDPEQWTVATPSPGWSVADQIGHLSYFDRTAVVAIEEPVRFEGCRDDLFTAALTSADALDQLTLDRARSMSPSELLEHWRDGRARLRVAASTLDDSSRVEWYGPSMSSRSFLTARLMETWAHGQDVVDAVGADRPPTDRLIHVAQLGVITRGWSYANRGLEQPASEVRVELVRPGGEMSTWGPEETDQSITGPIVDFCLVVTQRRTLEDTALEVHGDDAAEWMRLAQAFAGPPTDGPVTS